MATIYIDNKPYQVKDGQSLLDACLSLGFDVPYFCWHPAMHSVGACRQCAVKIFRDEKDARGRIVMSCMTPAAEGTRLSIDDPEVREFRARVIEWMMVNHPHDCPVCDEGGECHLQDMTVMTGHAYRRFRGKKRTFRNQDLGPLVNHEMNRCIQCYRCVRFYNDYAGGRDFGAFMLHNTVFFGRHEDGVLNNEFSGNLVEVCPTGVFTDKTLKRHYTRTWDMQTAPSLCVHCGLGCNTIPGERYGMLRRIRNRYNGEVNGYFLCDRGRYGYEFVNSDKRLRQPLLRDRAKNISEPATGEAALTRIAGIISGDAGVIGIGSPRASLEANFALRMLVGPDRFYSGMSDKEHRFVSAIVDILRKGRARTPSLHEVESADAVLVLGEDVTNTAPMLALALRQSVRSRPLEKVRKMGIPLWNDAPVREAVQGERGPLFIASPDGTKLDEIAEKTFRGAPDDLARLGFAVAREIDPDAPAVPGMSQDALALARDIAQALRNAARPLIVSGTSCGSEALLHAAACVAWALRKKAGRGELSFVVPECNSFGLGLMAGGNIADAFKGMMGGKADTVIVLENDLYRRADEQSVSEFLGKAKHIIVIDHLRSRTASAADVVLPAGTFAESAGTLVNNEGRAQRFYQVFVPNGDIQESRRWLSAIMAASGRQKAEQWRTLDDVTAAMTAELSVFKPVSDIAPSADFRVAGMKIPRQPHRYSGRTAIHANINVQEPKPPDDPDSALAFTMEGYEGRPPSPLISHYWAPGWNSVQALNKFQQEVGGPLRGGDPGRRLIEPSDDGIVRYFREVPEVFTRREGEWLVVPLHHIFGSEELSVLSPGITELAPRPYIALNPEDAARLQVKEGDIVNLSLAVAVHRLQAKIHGSLPAGVAGWPVELPESPTVPLPASGKIYV